MNARWSFMGSDAKLSSAFVTGVTVLILVFFCVPVATLALFSVREGRHLVLPFDGVSLQWYVQLLTHERFMAATLRSVGVAAVVTVLSTLLGTAAALGWSRGRPRLAGPARVLGIAPFFMPQLLLGIMLLLWFSVLGNALDFSLGLPTIVAGHVVYITPFAAILVAVRLKAVDPALEQAARDCGASTWQTYREVILPLLKPGITSAATFAFLISWSNFYLTFNLGGTAQLLPTFVYAGLAFNSSPLYPAIATVVFAPAIVVLLVAELRRRSRQSSNPALQPALSLS